MIEFIVRDMGFTEFQKAQLLGAFFPVHSISIIPAAAVAKIVGGKAMLNASLFGQALCLMLLPVAARAGGQRAVNLMCACMGGLGVLQGPLIPGLAPIEAAWIPPGPSRALALRIPHMGMRFHFLGALVIPVLATSRFGWRAAPISFGVGCGLLGLIWNSWITNTPAEWRGPPQMKDDEKVLFGLDKKKPETDDGGSKQLATYFFRCGRGYLPMLGHSIIAVVGMPHLTCPQFPLPLPLPLPKAAAVS
jgi:sugar phosphate permease